MSESKKRDSGPEKPRKPGRPEQRTTLAPLEFEEALADLIATGKPEDQTGPEDERETGS